VPPHKKKPPRGKHQVPSAAKTAAEPRKIPRVGEAVDFWESHPLWSFALLDFYAEVGGWIHLRPQEIDALLERFRRWETMTWREILAEGRKRNHAIDVSQCIAKAQERLRFLQLDDLEQLMSLSVSATARVMGILDRATFRILWWDPDHQVCPSHLKHT
jgi:hypothetical protein